MGLRGVRQPPARGRPRSARVRQRRRGRRGRGGRGGRRRRRRPTTTTSTTSTTTTTKTTTRTGTSDDRAPPGRRRDLRAREAALFARLRAFPSLIVAYSGGVDSAFLGWAATAGARRRALCVTADSPSYPERHRADGARRGPRASACRHEIDPHRRTGATRSTAPTHPIAAITASTSCTHA